MVTINGEDVEVIHVPRPRRHRRGKHVRRALCPSCGAKKVERILPLQLNAEGREKRICRACDHTWTALYRSDRNAARGWARTFPVPKGNQRRWRYLLDGIPAWLWYAFRLRCMDEGVSIRTQILTLLTAWVNTPHARRKPDDEH